MTFLVCQKWGNWGGRGGGGTRGRDDKQPLCLFDLNLMLFTRDVSQKAIVAQNSEPHWIHKAQ